MKEEWKAIPGHESIYEVSNPGRVKSLAQMRADERQWIKEKYTQSKNINRQRKRTCL